MEAAKGVGALFLGVVRLVLFDAKGGKIHDEAVEPDANEKVSIKVPQGGVAILEKVEKQAQGIIT